MAVKPNHEPFENNGAVPGEGLWPLPHTIENNIRYSLSAAERPTEDEELRLLHERKMQILGGLYQDLHDKGQLPGKVFRHSEGSEDYENYFVASWAGRNILDEPREVYFYDGRFWYKNELSPEVLDRHTEFLLDAHNAEMRVQALVHSTVRTPGHLAPIECLPGTYPVHFHGEETPTPAHKYYKPGQIIGTDVAVGESPDAALAEYLEDRWRYSWQYVLDRAYILADDHWQQVELDAYGMRQL